MSQISTGIIKSTIGNVILAFSAGLWILMIWYGSSYAIPQAMYGIMFLGGSIIIYSLIELRESVTNQQRLRGYIMSFMTIAGIIVTVLSIVEYHDMLASRASDPKFLHYILAFCVIFVVLYLTYDAFGSIFSIIVLLTFGYAYFGQIFPSIFFHSGMSELRILEVSVINMAGMYGRLTQVGATMVAPFLLFAGLIKAFGGFNVMLKFSTWIAQYLKTGVPQMATVMSMLVGSISGSAAANTSITGSFTIPLMKKNGISREKSAAIEAVASSGGQILPPVMGVAAFLMADLLGLPIFTIFTAALIPAIIFYMIVANGVRLTTLSDIENNESLELSEHTITNIDGRDLSSYVPTMSPLVYSTQFLIGVAYLLYSLGVERQPVLIAGYRTVIISTLLGILYVLIDQYYFIANQPKITKYFQKVQALIISGIEDGAKSTAGIMIILASIGAVIDILLTTGFPTMLSLLLSDIAGDSMLLLLIMTMITAIILGMGMPTPAAYLIVAILLAPTLVRYGIAELNAHFFVFYYAILSAITPPIAVGIIISSSISSSSFWKTSLEALKIAIPLFVLPFAFIYYPQIIASGTSDYLIAIAYGSIIICGLSLFTYALTVKDVPIINFSDARLSYPIRAVLVTLGLIILYYPVRLI